MVNKDLFLFEKVAFKTDLQHSFIATIFTENIKNLEREDVPIHNLSESQIVEVFDAVNKGSTAKESIVEILSGLSKNKKSDVKQAIEVLGLEMMNITELKQKVKNVVDNESAFVAKQPEIAFKKLLGKIIGDARGKVDAKIVSKLLSEEIKRSL